MNLCAIICEMNPLTNGHEYIIKKAKEITGDDILCLMSGNFVQRGEMAILSKFERAMSDIISGADLVFELPLPFAISPADKFSLGAIKVLESLRVVTKLAFGVETEDIETLKWIAEQRYNESEQLSAQIRSRALNGNYSLAIKEALTYLYPEKKAAIESIFNGPNNILAIEYLVALKKLNSKIEPVFIPRIDNGYGSLKPIKIGDKSYASAGYVRQLAKEGKMTTLKELVPKQTFDLLKEKAFDEYENRLSALIISNLQTKSKSQLNSYFDYNPSVSSLVFEAAKVAQNLSDFSKIAARKNLRESRAKRLALYPYFGLTKSAYSQLFSCTYPVNVLAVRKDKKDLLSFVIKQAKCPLLVSTSDRNNLSTESKKLAKYDQLGSALFNISTKHPQVPDKTLFV